MAFGSMIYPSRDELPRFTSDDLKRRAVDPEAWYDKFVATGIPPRDAPPQCVPTPSDVFRDVGGEDQEPRGKTNLPDQLLAKNPYLWLYLWSLPKIPRSAFSIFA